MMRLWQRMRLNRFVVLGRVGMDLYADPPGTNTDGAGRYFSAIGGSVGDFSGDFAGAGAWVARFGCVLVCRGGGLVWA